MAPRLFAPAYFVVVRHRGAKFILPRVEINMHTIVFESVRHHEIWGPEHHVVAHYLVESALRHRDIRRLELHDHKRTAEIIVSQRIEAPLCAVEHNPTLYGKPVRRKSQHINHIGNKILPHILLGSQRHPSRAQVVVDTHAPAGRTFKRQPAFRQIESGKSFHLGIKIDGMKIKLVCAEKTP